MPRTDSTFTTVPQDEARSVKAAKHTPSVMDMLRAGEMVFLPGRGPNSVAGWRTALKPENLAVLTRKGSRDGVDGLFVWTESKLDADDPEAGLADVISR